MSRRRREQTGRERTRRDQDRPGADFASSRSRQALVWLVTLKLAAIVVVFDPDGVQAFDFPKSLVSRGFEWLILGTLAVSLLRHGVGIVGRTRLHWFVLAFAATNGLSAIFAEDRYVAVFGERFRYLGLTFIGDVLVLYLAVAVAFRSRRDWLLAAAGLTAALFLSIAYAFAQRLGVDPIHWSEDPHDRPFGTLGQPDMFGQFLASSFAAALGVFAFSWRTAGRRTTWVAAAVAGLCLATAAIVATRGSLLGILAALGAAPFAYVRVYGASRTVLVRAALGSVTALAILGGILVGTPLGERVRATTAGVATSDRVLIYRSAFESFVDRPILGYGVDGFAVAYPHHRPAGDSVYWGPNNVQTSAHSWVLQTAATTGIVGLAALVALVLAFAWYAWRSLPRAPLIVAPLALASAAYWAHGLVTVGSIGVDWVPWLAFGGVARSSWREERSAPIWSLHQAVPRVMLLASVLASLTGWSAFLANRDALVNLEALSARETGRAISGGESATRRDPGRASYWNGLGLAYQAGQQLRRASDAFVEATRRAPQTATYWANLARVRATQALSGDASSGGRSAALEAARHAVAVDPNNPVAQSGLAEVANVLGDPDLAFGAAAMSYRLYASESTARLLGETALRSSDAAGARATLEQLVAMHDGAALRVALARVDLKMNDRQAALANVRRALELDGTNRDAQRMLLELGG